MKQEKPLVIGYESPDFESFGMMSLDQASHNSMVIFKAFGSKMRIRPVYKKEFKI